jgi:hypothetical protein
VYRFVCFGALCTVALVLRQNENSTIDGALTEDNFIPLLQRIGCNIKEISFQHDRASPHKHTADCSEEFACSVLDNSELLVQSLSNCTDMAIVLP